MRVAGVDGTGNGWCVVIWDGIGRAPVARLIAHLTDLDYLGQLDAVAIDMPIGLPDVACKGGRACDRAARKLLGPRRSSVFSPPARAALTAADYPAALACNRASGPDGVGLSKQAYNLFPKLREIDAWITPHKQAWVHEVHPELAFTVLARGRPMRHAKRTADGATERAAALATAGLNPVRAMVADVPGASRDDRLDALVLAWMARRIADGKGRSLPSNPPRDSRGLRMEIVY